MSRFSADFEDHCDGAVPGLFGAVRYNVTTADVRPFDGSYPTYQLTVTSSPNGQVTGPGIACGAGANTCVATYGGATTVLLTAFPQSGYAFLGWTGACSGGETTGVLINGPKVCSPIFEGTVPGAPRTLFVFDSRSGDPVGLGARKYFTTDNASVTTSTSEAGQVVALYVTSVDGGSFSFLFSNVTGTPLTAATYLNAQRTSPLYPRLAVNTSPCSFITGRFVVHEIAITNNTLTRFAADFEQHCNDIDAPLVGLIRYNSQVPGVVPFGGAVPAYQISVSPAASYRVTGTGINCGMGSNDCTETFATPTTITLTAVQDADKRVRGWLGACVGGQSVTVRVNSVKSCTPIVHSAIPSGPETLAILESEPGDQALQGVAKYFTIQNATIVAAGNGSELTFTIGTSSPNHIRLRFSAGYNQPAFAPGTYVVPTPFSSFYPSVQVTVDNTSCAPSGRFVIRELALGWFNTVDRLAIDFDLRCNASSTARFYGSLRYQSTIPASAPQRTPILSGQAARANGGWMPRTKARDENYALNDALRLPWNPYNATSGEVHPAFGDVDGDGLNEVVLGLGRGSGGWIAVLDDEAHGYAVLRWIQISWPNYNNANGSVYPAVGDLDGDGFAEIVAGLGQGGHGYLEIIGGANRNYQSQRWLLVDWPGWTSINGETHPAVGDLNNDGQAEIVVGLGHGASGWLHIFNDASLQFSSKQWLQVAWQAFTTRSGVTWPAVGDIDGNGTPEIVAGLGTGGEGWLQVWNAIGGTVQPREWLRVEWSQHNVLRCGETRPSIGRTGSAGPSVVVGFGTCTGVEGGWTAIVETALPGRPTIWRNDTDAAFKASGGGTFPAVIPR